ncbi:aldehyde dehydrogenase family protein [Novosphingobium piscinae]|uniref:Aldehyde dehydrogenase family protein n=1 Tax=Novosphingobium piscinae TaxID=1507448 RepID=A0A7X1FYZ4_9SPHN|nr:aldehyde dehydrogenase family protein [Novosphingobium piscinae]MBC2669565.1 aldehyde dehydrogenase family protein [Novosphingobium piscinae]
MVDATRFYIDGRWVAPADDARAAVVDPADRSVIGEVALGGPADAEAAIAAARAAFPGWSATTREQRLEYLEAINLALIARSDEIGNAIMREMGAPRRLARRAQAGSGPQHFGEVIRVLRDYPFETPLGSTLLQREAIGVCVLITPWNWPMNQIATKVAPALAAGCTMVLKPSELAPLDAVILAEIIDSVGLPAGVFNLVHGSGAAIGDALTGHPDVDMVSFTGSTRAGVAIAANAAPTIKRVALELGGKSACIVLPDADFAKAIPATVQGCMLNTGQSCNAPTRLMVPRARLDDACHLAKHAAEAIRLGMPIDDPDMGPVANEAQYGRVIAMIDQAISEGATLLTGGSAPPAGLERGLFVRPTVFCGVTPDMTIAREEVFGPVLAIMAYDSVEEAVALANDSPYGLSGYVWAETRDAARAVARQLRTGMVHLNGAPLDSAAPFGGYKMSGNGREWGRFGLEEFLEIKSIYGGAEA